MATLESSNSKLYVLSRGFQRNFKGDMYIENFNGSMDRRVTKASAVYVIAAGQVAELVGFFS